MNTTVSRRQSRPRPRATRRSSGHFQPHQAPAPLFAAFEAAPHDPTPVPFATLGLDDRLSRAIADLRFVQTTPVQSAVYPAVLAGQDLIACAQTGTGKTAGFLLPIMQRLLGAIDRGEPRTTRVLVLAPTRELAVQIEDDFQGLAYHTPLCGAAVYGGVGADAQDRALRAGVDIVVATPGRLLDHLSAGATRFEALEVLVLDEADRMMDMGFWPDVRRIIAALPAKRQTLLFSATISPDVVQSAAQIMTNPKVVQIGRTTGLATTIEHVGRVVRSDEKIEWLAGFLRGLSDPALVFVRTKRFADRLSSRLASRGIRCAALHADRSQRERTAAVEGFRAGRHRVLVATDIAARGLDIEGIGHVINYEVPDTVDTYVHRVGRTGRADALGTALTLVTPEDIKAFNHIERALNVKFADSPATRQ